MERKFYTSIAREVILEDRAIALEPYEDRPAITTPEAGFDQLSWMAGADREVCMALMLDTKHRLIEAKIVSLGSVDHTFMAPREILRDALLSNASAFVVAHNHPSGDPEPSKDDIAVTRRLIKASEIVGIDMLDHLIIGGGQWVSMARRGIC